MRHDETRAEGRPWQWLRQRRFLGFKFRRQHPMDRYILDFYCPELQLAIEVDGRHHRMMDMTTYDGDRSAALHAVGIEVVRISNDALKQDSRLVEETIEHAIRKRAKHG